MAAAAAAARGFDPRKSTATISVDSFATFVHNPVIPDLLSVPGIGDAAVEKLAAVGVTTTHQLLGKFLSLRTAGISVVDHANAMYAWLADIKIVSQRDGIVRAVAEKANVWTPGVYDAKAFA